MAKAELGTKAHLPELRHQVLRPQPRPDHLPAVRHAVRGGRQHAGAARLPPPQVEEEEDVEVAGRARPEFVPLEEADEEAADSGAVEVEGDDEEEIEAEERRHLPRGGGRGGDDVSDIIGDVDEEEPLESARLDLAGGGA